MKNYVSIVIFIVGCPLLNVVAQQNMDTTRLVYAQDNTPLRNFIIVQNNDKIVSKVEEGAQSIAVYLMNRENLITDTIGYYWFDDVLPVGENRVLITTYNKNIVIQHHQGRIQAKQEFVFCESSHLGPVFFRDKAYLPYGISSKKNLPRVDVILTDTSKHHCLNLDGRTYRISATRKVKLTKNLIWSLPVTIGLGTDHLAVFLRDAQELLLFDSSGYVSRLLLPTGKDQVWHYLYDWQEDDHYFIRATPDEQLELFRWQRQKLRNLQPLTDFPTQIIGGRLIFCQGSFKTNCDFYEATIRYRPTGEDIIPEIISRQPVAQQ